MSRLNMEYLETVIGVQPRIEQNTGLVIGKIIGGGTDATARRNALNEWLVLNGIPRIATTKALAASVAKAYTIPSYLSQWRVRVNPRWAAALGSLGDEANAADGGLDTGSDIFLDPSPPEPKPSAKPETKLAEMHGSQLKELLAKAADAVIPPRLRQVEHNLNASLDNKLRNAKLELSEDAKASIRLLAREAGRAEVERLMPPRRIEIADAKRNVTIDLGVQHKQFPVLLKACQARNSDGNRLNIMLAGPAGTGKTTAGKMVAKALSLPFGSDSSLDADYKVVGHNNVNGQPVRTEFWRIWTGGGVYVADEIDNWNPSALTALNPAFGNGWLTFPDGIAERHKDCIIIACANTWGLGATADYVGRSRLDAASLDRLQPKIAWDIDEDLERAIAKNEAGTLGLDWCNKVQQARRAAARQGLKILITPRATLTGIALLAQGFSEAEVISMTMTASLSSEQAKAIGLWRAPS